jgi:hypothetical protein
LRIVTIIPKYDLNPYKIVLNRVWQDNIWLEDSGCQGKALAGEGCTMKHRLLAVTMLGGLALSVAPVAAAQRTNAKPNSVEFQVLAVEKARVAAVLTRDVKKLDTICGDDLTYIHASGRVDTKASYIEAIRSDELHYIAWDPKELHVRVFGDTAVLNGEYHVRVINRRMQPDPLDMDVFILTVYVQRDGRWQQVAWQTTKDVGSPTVGAPPAPTSH